MRIGTILQHPLEYSLGTSTRVLGLSKTLSRKGVEVYLFVPLEQSRKISENIWLHNIQTSVSSIRLYKLLRYFYGNPFLSKKLILNNRMLRIAEEQISNSVLACIHKNKLQLDVIQGEQEIPSLSAIDIAHKLNIPSVAHFHNIWAEEAMDLGLIKTQNTLLSKLTTRIVNSADLIITPSLPMKEYLQKNYSAQNIEYIPTCAPRVINRNYNQPYRVVYSGMWAKHENVENFIEAATIVSKENPHAEFFITGKGGNLSKLKKLANQLKSPVKFIWLSTSQEYFEFLRSSHIGVIPWANTISRKLGYPTKLLDYSAAGMAIVATNIGGWTQIIENNHMGLLVEPNSIDMATVINNLLKHTDQISEMGKNGQKVALEQSEEKISNALLKVYSNLLGRALLVPIP